MSESNPDVLKAVRLLVGDIVNKERYVMLPAEPGEGDPVLGKLLELFWHLEKVPAILKKTILVPLLKDSDGDVHDPANYRPIALCSNFSNLPAYPES